MNISPLGAPPTPANSTPAAATREQNAQTREVAKAIRIVNASASLPDDRQFSLSIDQATKTPVVRVIDTTTDQVIEQFPAEYILKLAAFFESEASRANMAQKPSV